MTLTRDAFLGGRVQAWQPAEGYRAAMDPVLLAAACPARQGQAVLELGCGVGVASLCLAARVPGLALTGLELQPAYADLARRNAAENAAPLTVIEGDLAAMPAELRARAFDHVIANPPYYPAGGGTPARDAGRETALREATPLALWVAAGMRRLRPGGIFTLIQDAARLPEVLAATGPSVTVLPIAPRDGRPARRVIVQARKGGRAAFRLLAPLVLHHGPTHGTGHSDRAEDILRHGAAIEL